MSDWKVVKSEDEKVEICYKGENKKGVVWVKVRFRGEKRWFVFKGGLKFDEIVIDGEGEDNV